MPHQITIPGSNKQGSRPRKVFSAIKSLFRPTRDRVRGGPSEELRASKDDFPDATIVDMEAGRNSPTSIRKQPSPPICYRKMGLNSGDMTVDIETPKMSNPELPKADPLLVPPIPAIQSSVARVPATPPQLSEPPSKPSSLMRLAGAKRDSDLIAPPFNLWGEIVKAITDLGVTSDIVSPKPLINYIDLPGREELWYQDSAVELFKSEIIPYKLAITYITNASKYVMKPHSSTKKKSAWMELGGFDFRLNSVDRCLQNLIGDITACKNKCMNTTAERRMALNASDLIEVLWQLKRLIANLRETIILVRFLAKAITALDSMSEPESKSGNLRVLMDNGVTSQF
ncbi:hypothetical protein TWF730_008453 [Orbilia blumenaviensis]|uniref:Uncharacterized protein n=1 Tax=Orbilia blumenaviensis TaxID=1796055 RepID=A0AAV9V2N7_9PEZI